MSQGHVINYVPEQSAAAMMDGLITTLNHEIFGGKVN